MKSGVYIRMYWRRTELEKSTLNIMAKWCWKFIKLKKWCISDCYFLGYNIRLLFKYKMPARMKISSKMIGFSHEGAKTGSIAKKNQGQGQIS